MYDKKQNLNETVEKRPDRRRARKQFKRINSYNKNLFAKLRKQHCHMCGTQGKIVQLQYCTICGKPVCPNCGVLFDFISLSISCLKCDEKAFKKSYPETEYRPIVKEVRNLQGFVKKTLTKNGMNGKTKLSISPNILNDHIN